jgi:maltose alpha-D-glucosyltransferase / alpha-amylase
MANEPWYADAVVYAIDVEKFADGNGDGIGDFAGLTSRLDYLQTLGVTCLWLLPFYASPRRDNGYDVSDHYRVDPRLGTLDEFIWFVRLAGERGISVVIDIVMDHTSDSHPWFQASRRDPKSRFRDYYTWSEQPPPLEPGKAGMFPGEEPTIWMYDEVAGAYYYHPFYRFQPQLCMNNPEVREELMRLLDFWMSFGVAGFRFDALPTMLGLDGPGVGKPRDPHAILQNARSLVSARRADTMLLGEVDLAAGHLSAYFGDGDELNNMLNFQLNNYLFLALATEKAAPVLRGLRQLPDPPPRCQWINFLRNHDELNIQWLPEEDRDVVWNTFAPESEMRVYGRGIRRRLAPMIGDRDKLELAFSLLMTMPGSPQLFYGDELGMGENLELPGRDAVRTLMQWSGRRNGGFSDVAPSKLVRPMVADGEYGYRNVNVEAQLNDPASMLSATRRLIDARKRTVEIGRGGWNALPTKSDAVLAHQILWRDSMVVFVHNLGTQPQQVVIDLRDHPAEHLERIVGKGMRFSRTAEREHLVELDRYGYGWFRVSQCTIATADLPEE